MLFLALVAWLAVTAPLGRALEPLPGDAPRLLVSRGDGTAFRAAVGRARLENGALTLDRVLGEALRLAPGERARAAW